MTEEMKALNRNKPAVYDDEVLCSGCWEIELKEAATTERWVIMTFRHLDMVVLCPKCQYAFGEDFDRLQKAGL